MTLMTDEEAIAAVRAGKRAVVALSLFREPTDPGSHTCTERVIVCDEPTDVVECPQCGKQRVVRCNFDDDYA